MQWQNDQMLWWERGRASQILLFLWLHSNIVFSRGFDYIKEPQHHHVAVSATSCVHNNLHYAVVLHHAVLVFLFFYSKCKRRVLKACKSGGFTLLYSNPTPHIWPYLRFCFYGVLCRIWLWKAHTICLGHKCLGDVWMCQKCVCASSKFLAEVDVLLDAWQFRIMFSLTTTNISHWKWSDQHFR